MNVKMGPSYSQIIADTRRYSQILAEKDLEIRIQWPCLSSERRNKEMAKRHPLKVTVIKKLSSKEVYGNSLPEVSEEMAPYCDRLETGQEFRVDEAGTMPAGFCTWAWHDIYPVVTSLRFGGNFPWMKKEGMIISCCSDGARPVFFRIERV
jgi:uncharacterized repeat protein (TIGR04076 family)